VSQRELSRVRQIALALPEVSERFSHGAVCFFVQDKRPLCYYHDNHRGDGRVSLWCPAPPGLQEILVAAKPKQFFKPMMSAAGTFRDWVGVFLDTPEVDWAEIAIILDDAFRTVAPKKLIAKLDGR
jgi:hypothetical protein